MYCLIKILKHTTARFVKRFKTEASILGGGGQTYRFAPNDFLIINNMQCNNSFKKHCHAPQKLSNLTHKYHNFHSCGALCAKSLKLRICARSVPIFCCHFSHFAPPPPNPINGSTPLSQDTDSIYVLHKRIITY